MILRRSEPRSKPRKHPLPHPIASLPFCPKTCISRERSPGNEGARISQVQVRKRTRLEEGAEGVVALIENIPHHSEKLDIFRHFKLSSVRASGCYRLRRGA